MGSFKIEIDKSAGFCFGVDRAVAMAGRLLNEHGHIYCLGSLVHNNREVKRLEEMGLEVISREDLPFIKNSKVLIRAHGEPPQTYQTARENNIELIDATCKVVLKLQSRIKNEYLSSPEDNRQIVIFGKKGHPEVDGLIGQTNGQAILVSDSKNESLKGIDFTRPVTLYCQTTQSLEGYAELVEAIKSRLTEENREKEGFFVSHDTICRQVAGRSPLLEKFASAHDIVIFVSGKQSSNGTFLFEFCRKVNPRSYKISGPEEVDHSWFKPGDNIGISGATSTPQWLMEAVAEEIERTPH